MENTNANGAYDLEGIVWHQFSNKLMIEILKLFPKDIPVWDFGCGMNFYVKVLIYAGYKAKGVDAVSLGNFDFVEADLTKPFPNIHPQFIHNIISLETGEHLPEEGLDNYLDTLTKWKGNVLMSWALPGQAGHGHINCRSNAFVIEEMKKRGYEMDFQTTHHLRQSVVGCHCKWFQQTLMYFKPMK